MNNLNTRIILINQYFRLFFKFYTPPISNLYICQFSRQKLESLRGARYFCTLDAAQRYMQCAMEEKTYRRLHFVVFSEYRRYGNQSGCCTRRAQFETQTIEMSFLQAEDKLPRTHVVSEEGLSCDPQKTEAIDSWPKGRDRAEDFLNTCWVL